MISFDLKCGHDHVFEAWFRNSGDFEDQRGRRLIECPFCGDADIGKAVMAPAVAAKGNRRADDPSSQSPAVAEDGVTDEKLKAVVAALAQAQAEMLKTSQWVGDAFADKARAMYYGEAKQAAIHGTVKADEARAMMEEGVPVAPLIVPVAPPEGTH